MRFSIERFDQKALLDVGLDLKDMTILMYIIDFFNSNKMYIKIIDNKIFFWINYQTVLDELPILDIKDRQVLARRFDKYVECNLMEKHVVRGDDEYLHKGEKLIRKGVYIYFHINPDVLGLLLGNDPQDESQSVPNQSAKDVTSMETDSERGLNLKVERVSTQKLSPSQLKSLDKDINTINSFTKDINLIVGEAQSNEKFNQAFSNFLLSDDIEHRKNTAYWIFHNAKKYTCTLEDVIHALEICYDKEKVGDMSYFTGILRKKAQSRNDGIIPYGKPTYWVIDEYLRKRCATHSEYIKHYEFDLDTKFLYYSVSSPDDRQAVHDVMKIISNDLEKEVGVKLEPRFRIG